MNIINLLEKEKEKEKEKERNLKEKQIKEETMTDKIIQFIRELTNMRCDRSHIKCYMIQNNFLKILKENPHIHTQSFINKYIKILASKNCLTTSMRWLPTMQELCKTTTPDAETLIKLLTIFNYSKPIFEQLLNQNIILEPKVMLYLINNSLLHIASLFISKLNNSIDEIHEYYLGYTRVLEQLCTKSYSTQILKYLLENNIEITDICIYNTISTQNLASLSCLINSKREINYNVNMLIAACRTKNADIISKLVMCKIQPNRDCFYELFKTVLSNVKYINVNPEATIIANLVNILLIYGYKLEFEDVAYMLKYKCYVPELSRFNYIYNNLNKNLLELCTEEDYYPYDYLNLKPNLKCLQLECSKGRIDRIHDIILRGITPDVSCLKAACASVHHNSSNIVELLVNTYRVRPTLECILSITNKLHIDGLDFLLEKIEKVTFVNYNTDKDEFEEDWPEEEVTEIKVKIKEDLVTLEEIKNIKENKDINEKQVISPTVLEVFRIHKNKKLTFVELREAFLEYITENELHKKNIITLDKKLLSLFKFKKSNVDILYLDNLISFLSNLK